MSDLAAKGFNLLQKLEAVYADVRKQEHFAFQLSRQKDIANTFHESSEVPVQDEFHNNDEPDQWNAKYELMTRENKELKVKNEKLSTQNRSKESANQQLTEKLKKTIAANEILQKEKDDQFSECLMKWSDSLKIDGLLKSIAKETETYKNAVSKIQELYSRQETEVGLLRHEMDAASLHNDNLSCKCIALNSSNAQLLSKVDTLSKENTEMRVNNVSLTSEKISFQSQLQEKDHRIRELEAQCQRVQSELQHQRDLAESLQRSLNELQTENEKRFADWFKVCQAHEEGLSRMKEMIAQKDIKPSISIHATTTTTPIYTNDPLGSSVGPLTSQAQGRAEPFAAASSFVPQSNPADPINTTSATDATVSMGDSVSSERPSGVVSSDLAPVTSPSLKRGHSVMVGLAPPDSDSGGGVSESHSPSAKKTNISGFNNASSASASPLLLTKKPGSVVKPARGMNTVPPAVFNCGACSGTHREPMTAKCQSCQTCFHGTCKKKILKERLGLGSTVISTDPVVAPFLCNNCFY